MTPAEAWKASTEALAFAQECRAQRCHWWADLFAGLSDDFADQACDLERKLGIVREDVA